MEKAKAKFKLSWNTNIFLFETFKIKLYRYTKPWTGEMTQSLNCLLYKLEDTW